MWYVSEVTTMEHLAVGMLHIKAIERVTYRYSFNNSKVGYQCWASAVVGLQLGSKAFPSLYR